jgi:hypothetical protein
MNEEEAQANQNALAEEDARQKYLEGESAAAIAEAEASESEKAYNDGFLEGKKVANTFCEKANEHLKEQINILDAQKASLIKQITTREARDAIQLKEINSSIKLLEENMEHEYFYNDEAVVSSLNYNDEAVVSSLNRMKLLLGGEKK